MLETTEFEYALFRRDIELANNYLYYKLGDEYYIEIFRNNEFNED